METMEKLFVQIFERKKRIEEQVKRQTLLFDQQLASKCLLDGIAPPHWLFSASPNAELNKVELISGLLLPHPSLTLPYSSNCCSLYNKPTVQADKGDLPDSILTQVSTSDQGFDAGDRLSISPQLPLNGVRDASNGVQKGDIGDAKSLPDQGVERLLEVSPETSRSLENFQRSKSRQRALALHNSATLVSSTLQDKSNAGVLAGRITGSQIATLQHDHSQELDLVESVDISRESCKVEEEKLGEFQGKGNVSRMEEIISPLNLCLQPATSHSSCECVPFCKLSTRYDNEELPHVSDKEIHTLSKKVVPEDGQSNLHQFTISDAKYAANDALEMDLVAASPKDHRSSGSRVIDFKPLQSLVRVQRSKSRQQAVEVRNSAKADRSCLPLESDMCVYSGVVNRSGITSLQSDHESTLIKTTDYQSKEKTKNIYSGRTTRSQNSGQQPSSRRESSDAGTFFSAGRPSRYHYSEGCPESSKHQIQDSGSLGKVCDYVMVDSSPQLKQQNVGGRLMNVVRAAPSLREDNVVHSNEKRSPVDKMDQLMMEGSKSSPIGVSPQQPDQIQEPELVNIADFNNESCKVEGAKIHDFRSKDRSSNLYSVRIKGSRSSALRPSFMRESSHSGKLADAMTAGNSIGCPELIEQKIGGRLIDAVSYSQSSLRDNHFVQSNKDTSLHNKMDHVEQLMIKASKSSALGISSPERVHIHESEFVKPANFDGDTCQVEVVKVLDIQSNDKSSNPYSGRVTRSQRPVRQPSSTRVSLHARNIAYAERCRTEDHVVCSESSEQKIEENSVSIGRGFGSAVVGSSPHLSQIKDGSGQADVMPTSPILRQEDNAVRSIEDRSPVDKMSAVEQLVTEGSQSSPTGMSSFEPDQIHESEFVRTPGFDNESLEVEGGKLYGFLNKEKTSSIDSGRIIGSRSSVQQPGSIRGFSHADSHLYPERSSRDGKTVDHPESSEQQNEGTSASLEMGYGSGMRCDEEGKDPVDKVANVEQLVTEQSKSSPSGISYSDPGPVYELQMSKSAEAYCESCSVEEENVNDIQSKENSSNAGSDRITRYQSHREQQSSIRDSFELGNSVYSGMFCTEDKIVGSSELRQKSGNQFSLSGNNFSYDGDDSWPQYKRRKVEGPFNDHHLSAFGSLMEEGAAKPDVNKSQVVERGQNVAWKIKREFQSSHKLQIDKDSEMALISSFMNQASGDPKACSDVEAAVSNTTRAILEPDKQSDMGGKEILLHLDDTFELGNNEHLNFAEGSVHERKCHLGENGKSSNYSTWSPQRETTKLIVADQVTPEFERFIMETDNGLSCPAGDGLNFNELNLPKSTIECASVLEQLCKSSSVHTPSSHFTMNKFHPAQNLSHSMPRGLLECIDLRNYPSINDNLANQLKAGYRFFDEKSNHALQGRNSDALPFSSGQTPGDIKKPFRSPIGKYWDITAANSSSLGKWGNSNPELPCISEENENMGEVADTFQDGIGSEVALSVGELWDCTNSNSSRSKKRGSLNSELPFICEEEENKDRVADVHQGIGLRAMHSSVKREPLADITENPDIPASVSEADTFAARDSLESVKTEYNFPGTCNRAKQRYGHRTINKINHTRLAKMSHTSLEGNGINRVSETRFSRQKLSGKPSLRKGGPSFADREIKCTNIVSNLSSFEPLVQQKQAAVTITGKRDVKVKALEAAEAAKRLAEEKENERKMKKEAMKLERAKLEQENLKQVQLQKKKKEEERKKKEVEMAARKRQREEEEMKEKEWKRKRVLEARKQQQEHDAKLHAKKEEERKKKEANKVMDERLNLTKLPKDETWRECKTVKEQRDVGNTVKTTLSTTTGTLTSKARETSTCEPSTDFGDKSMMTSHLEKAVGTDLVTRQTQEPSYEISPYKDSDNEEEEDDDRPNTKFIPSWASKHASALIISSLQTINPEVIFPLGSFCSISEVLLPRGAAAE